MDLEIKGNIVNADDVKAMINAAPEVYTRFVRRVMNAAGRYFIGSRRGGNPKRGQISGKGSSARTRAWKEKFLDPAKHGLIRSQLANKKSGLNRAWSDKFINATMSYRLENADRLEMKMRAGTLYTNKKKIHEIMEFFEQGGTISSNKFMPVPITQNFDTRKDTFKGYRALFPYLIKQKRLATIFKNGKVYYVDKQTGKLLFVGTKSVTVKKQFEFYGKWNEAQPKIIADFHNAIDNATKDVMELNSNG